MAMTFGLIFKDVIMIGLLLVSKSGAGIEGGMSA